MTFVMPPKSQVGYLSPEISGEGSKVIMSDGEQVSWSPPPPAPVMPDWSTIKSIRHYFGRTGGAVWPAWLYHPTEPARIVKNEHEAAELGVCYREASFDERGRYGRSHVWDWQEGCLWRPTPRQQAKFDPANPGSGKTYMASAPNPAVAQNALLAELVPLVSAAVATALKSSGPAAPANIDPADWEAFLQFKAFTEANRIVDAAVESEADEPRSALNALSPDEERKLWEQEAETKGIKVDGRWSLDRLKAEVQKAA